MDTDIPYQFYGSDFSIKVSEAVITGSGPDDEGIDLNQFSINRYNGQLNYARVKDGKMIMIIHAQCANAQKQF
jgi:hypothetical protein